jgi:hypothetical protein
LMLFTFLSALLFSSCVSGRKALERIPLFGSPVGGGFPVQVFCRIHAAFLSDLELHPEKKPALVSRNILVHARCSSVSDPAPSLECESLLGELCLQPGFASTGR